MIRERYPRERSYPAWLQFIFIALVLLITIVAMLLALWLVRQQLDRQAWARLEQGALATEALYKAQQRSLGGWVRLLVERPTLRTLLTESDPAALPAR